MEIHFIALMCVNVIAFICIGAVYYRLGKMRGYNEGYKEGWKSCRDRVLGHLSKNTKATKDIILNDLLRISKKHNIGIRRVPNTNNK